MDNFAGLSKNNMPLGVFTHKGSMSARFAAGYTITDYQTNGAADDKRVFDNTFFGDTSKSYVSELLQDANFLAKLEEERVKNERNRSVAGVVADDIGSAVRRHLLGEPDETLEEFFVSALQGKRSNVLTNNIRDLTVDYVRNERSDIANMWGYEPEKIIQENYATIMEEHGRNNYGMASFAGGLTSNMLDKENIALTLGTTLLTGVVGSPAALARGAGASALQAGMSTGLRAPVKPLMKQLAFIGVENAVVEAALAPIQNESRRLVGVDEIGIGQAAVEGFVGGVVLGGAFKGAGALARKAKKAMFRIDNAIADGDYDKVKAISDFIFKNYDNLSDDIKLEFRAKVSEAVEVDMRVNGSEGYARWNGDFRTKTQQDFVDSVIYDDVAGDINNAVLEDGLNVGSDIKLNKAGKIEITPLSVRLDRLNPDDDVDFSILNSVVDAFGDSNPNDVAKLFSDMTKNTSEYKALETQLNKVTSEMAKITKQLEGSVDGNTTLGKVFNKATSLVENSKLKKRYARLESEVATMQGLLDSVVKKNEKGLNVIADNIKRVEAVREVAGEALDDIVDELYINPWDDAGVVVKKTATLNSLNVAANNMHAKQSVEGSFADIGSTAPAAINRAEHLRNSSPNSGVRLDIPTLQPKTLKNVRVGASADEVKAKVNDALREGTSDDALRVVEERVANIEKQFGKSLDELTSPENSGLTGEDVSSLADIRDDYTLLQDLLQCKIGV